MRLIAALVFVMLSFTAEAQFLKKTFKFATFYTEIGRAHV